MNVSDARILITGGGRGIGRFLASNLLQKAEKIFVFELNESLLETIPKHENVLAFQCDVTAPHEVELLVRKIFEEHGGINVCINNAGIIHNEPIVNILRRGDRKHDIGNWNRVIDVNLNAVFHVSSNVIEQMVNKRIKGVIINISSISAQGNAGQSVYAASKAAVEALAKTWAKELGMFNIRCVSIAPGFFDTQSTKESISGHMLEKWQKQIPTGRFGKLEELLSSVGFVIENEYFNGKTLSLDGGLTI